MCPFTFPWSRQFWTKFQNHHTPISQRNWGKLKTQRPEALERKTDIWSLKPWTKAWKVSLVLIPPFLTNHGFSLLGFSAPASFFPLYKTDFIVCVTTQSNTPFISHTPFFSSNGQQKPPALWLLWASNNKSTLEETAYSKPNMNDYIQESGFKSPPRPCSTVEKITWTKETP